MQFGFHPLVRASINFETGNNAVKILCRSVKSIGRGVLGGNPNINDKNVTLWIRAEVTHGNKNLVRGFVRENPGAKKKSTIPQ
jgi:hypothetical protein